MLVQRRNALRQLFSHYNFDFSFFRTQCQMQNKSMSYDLEITNTRDYLYARITGKNSKENVRLYLEELVQECAKAKCRHLLIEERLEGPRLDSMSVFDIASEGSVKSRSLLRAVAYVDTYAEGSSMKNAETFAANRGLNVRVFRTVAEAKKWLTSLA